MNAKTSLPKVHKGSSNRRVSESNSQPKIISTSQLQQSQKYMPPEIIVDQDNYKELNLKPSVGAPAD